MFIKVILYFIIGIFAVSLGIVFLPLVIGGLVAWYNFNQGNVVIALLAIVIGLLGQWGLFALLGISGGGGGFGDDCPYCGGGDTDGNHCHSCGEDF